MITADKITSRVSRLSTTLNNVTQNIDGYSFFDFRQLSITRAIIDLITQETMASTGASPKNVIQTRDDSIITYSASTAGLDVGYSLLCEDAATNEQLYSQEFDNAAWLKRGTAAVVANDAVAPDGTTTMDKLTVGANGVDDIRMVLGAGTFSNSVPISPSFFINPVSTTGNISLRQVNGGATLGRWTIDLSLVSDGDRITKNHPAVTEVVVWVSKSDGNGGLLFSADSGTKSFQVWGAQLEEADDPSSYIKAEAVAVTRAQDDNDVTPDSLPSDNFRVKFYFNLNSLNFGILGGLCFYLAGDSGLAEGLGITLANTGEMQFSCANVASGIITAAVTPNTAVAIYTDRWVECKFKSPNLTITMDDGATATVGGFTGTIDFSGEDACFGFEAAGLLVKYPMINISQVEWSAA